jgi:hypothetical protein
MLVTLAFCGFREVERRADGLVVFEGDPERIQGPPDYVDVRIVREAGAVVAPAAELTAV